MQIRWIFLTLYVCFVIIRVRSDCVMYGQFIGDGNYPLAYNGTARPLKNHTSLNKLKSLCPHLFLDYAQSNHLNLCCNAEQIDTLSTQFSRLSSIIGRCPACATNLRQLLCHLTCSADQHRFMSVDIVPFETDDPDGFIPENLPKEYVGNLTVNFSRDYGHKLYNSCRNVQYSLTNQPAIHLLCGRSSGCDAERLFENMGLNSGNVFDTHFAMVENTTYFPPVAIQAWNCWESFYNGFQHMDSCSCTDCYEACNLQESSFGHSSRDKGAPFSIQNNTKRVAGMQVAHFTVLVAFILFLLLFFLAELWHNDNANHDESLSDEDIQNLNYKSQWTNNRISPILNLSNSENRHPWILFNNWIDKLGYKLQRTLSKCMQRLGIVCGTYPYTVITGSIMIIIALSCGIMFYDVTTDPIELWSSPYSRHRQAKNIFDEKFGHFYRITQIIIKPNSPNLKSIVPAVFSAEMMDLTINLTKQLSILSFPHSNKTHTVNVKFADVCVRPMQPDNENCLIYSISEYFQNDKENLYRKDTNLSKQYDYMSHITTCVKSPMNMKVDNSNMSCMSTFGVPMPPYMILGGFDIEDEGEMSTSYLHTSKAFVITMIGKNGPKNDSMVELAMSWEKGLIKWLDNFAKQQTQCSITFRTERSIEDEIERESHSDIFTIAMSYTIMFIYISISLGFSGRMAPNRRMSSQSSIYTNFKLFFVNGKLTIAMVGVLIAMLSVLASVGFFSFLRVSTSLIVFEVVPFLVLAVGVDNIFLLTKSLQNVQTRQNKISKTIPDQLGHVVSRVGPGILLTGSAECIAFIMGTMTNVPAVRMFSLYASIALFIDFCLQLTLFISTMSLDAQRQLSGRFDFLCCFKMNADKRKKGTTRESSTAQASTSLITKYSRVLLHRKIRPFIILIFSTWAFSSIMIIGKLPIGLDPKLTVPRDSYVLKFMDDMQSYLRVGPPVYFMLISESNLNFQSDTFRRSICGRSGCDSDSLMNQIGWAASRSNISRIAHGASSWIDDYEQWSYSQSGCCLLTKSDNTFCSANNVTNKDQCSSCPNAPFGYYIENFLKDQPGRNCPLGGRAAYKDALVIKNSKVKASHFMTYHTLLVTSEDFIGALRSAEWLAANITRSLHDKGFHDVTVIPYSVFYVFYEQYINIWHTTLVNVSISVLAIFCVSFVLLGFDITSAVIIVVSIAMITVNLGGLMYLWNIELNAISLVNVVMSLGISVEFCAHIVREFALINFGSREQRSRIALVNVGESVFNGITLTKIGGIIVLAFSHSQLFQVFYFRMYLCIIFCGALHGLVFLPVLLSYTGPSIRWTFDRKSIIDQTNNPENAKLEPDNPWDTIINEESQ